MNRDFTYALLCCIVFIAAAGNAHASNRVTYAWNIALYDLAQKDSIPAEILKGFAHKIILTGDSVEGVLYFTKGSCKQQLLVYSQYHHVSVLNTVVSPKETPVIIASQAVEHKKFHGDVSYDFSTHSSPDTTYPGSGFNQNYVTANVYTTIKDRYPVIFHIGTLQTTIPYVRNNFDISLQFDQHQYGSDMADQYRKKYQDKVRKTELEDSMTYRAVLSNFNATQQLEKTLGGDKEVQELMKSGQVINGYAAQAEGLKNSDKKGLLADQISKRDTAVSGTLLKLDSLKAAIGNPSIQHGLSSLATDALSDSTRYTKEEFKKAQKFILTYLKQLETLKKLKNQKDSLQHRYDSLSGNLRNGKDSLNHELSGDLRDVSKNNLDSTGSRPPGSWMLGIRQLGIGRSFINYSELSAKNLSLFGVNAEYCDHYYFALAAGKTDFRYQDFLTSTAVPNQYVFLARAGIGEKERKHFYFTIYTGSKQASYYVNNQPTTTKLTGFTIEGRYPVSKNIDITGEVAKSTAPSYVLQNNSPAKITSFGDHNNEAYSLQIRGYFPKTDTRVGIIYNRYGIYFQSFNIYNNNATSSSWQARVDQSFFRKKLLVSASIRQNDYTNPFIVNNYKSQTLVYSFQSTLRIKKWPTVTLGYLPFSQLSIIQSQITENRFYTLYGSANYAYRYRRIFLNSSFVYTQYFNSSNQVGFLYYNAQSYFFNQAVIIKKITINAAATYSKSDNYRIFSVGPNLQWNIYNFLSLGGGVKYNELNGSRQNIGYNGNIDCQFGKIGKIGLSYDKGFIPSQDNRFFRNDWGRATYSKIF